MIYISLPYSSPEKVVRKQREEMARLYFSQLVKEGKVSTSPILTGCIAEHYIDFNEVPYSFWMELTEAYLKQCSELHILTLIGWDSSTGVRTEIEYAKKHGLKIVYIEVYMCAEKFYFREKN
jgi:hypothetical protein